MRSRLLRLTWVGAIAALCSLWYTLPLLLNMRWLGEGHWSETWRDNSFGAGAILKVVANGQLLDATRIPVLTTLALLGVVLAWRSHRFLVWFTLFWLVAWWGPATWGRIPQLAGMLQMLQPHRFQLPFEIGAVLLAAVALERIYQWVSGHDANA